jgi:hypothetical protein
MRFDETGDRLFRFAPDKFHGDSSQAFLSADSRIPAFNCCSIGSVVAAQISATIRHRPGDTAARANQPDRAGCDRDIGHVLHECGQPSVGCVFQIDWWPLQ